ncbi:MAG: BirA family transcriptional regulator [Chloroflexota bacterium]|jgi:BirA family biotin operon repressor/biotin-[acetyl-CoA-carboxylase] ligase|nr:BirA family transcriptional regulator [Chloroflexota bacterium]
MMARPDAFLSRLERFGSIESTQPVVREWLEAGVPEVAVAVADEQTMGRGRQGRGWSAPPGTALLASAGFRPQNIQLGHAWRLAAIVALAMADAAEEVAGLKDATIWLKWPNDLVADAPDGRLVKLAGVLGESTSDGASGLVTTAIIGIGINADWPAGAFPPELRDSMTSLRELLGGRPIDRDALLDAWLARLEPRYEALRDGHFDAGGWTARQRTTGHGVEVDTGGSILTGTGVGVDPESGALLVRGRDGATQPVGSGEVVRCRVMTGNLSWR